MFDQDKVQAYLNSLSKINRSYVKEILDNTIFIKTNEMLSMVRSLIIDFQDKHDKYNLHIPNYKKNKIGSEHYIIYCLFDILKPVKLVSCNEDVDNEFPILFIDDAIYSSINICGQIDENNYNKLNNKLFIICCVLSHNNTEVKMQFNANVISYMNLDQLRLCNMFPGKYEYFYSNFNCETDCVLPVLFEHKIANEFGSYQFYHKLIKVDRSCIDNLTTQMLDDKFKIKC